MWIPFCIFCKHCSEYKGTFSIWTLTEGCLWGLVISWIIRRKQFEVGLIKALFLQAVSRELCKAVVTPDKCERKQYPDASKVNHCAEP